MNDCKYKQKHQIRIITATSIFDGHDASINLIRRMLQSKGIHVIHLGHNRSAHEIVESAIQEDVQAIAVSSYQGGHMEFYKYLFDLLNEKGYGYIKIFGGGGGVILVHEIEELHRYGICHVFSPEEVIKIKMDGMIDEIMIESDYSTIQNYNPLVENISIKYPGHVSKWITCIESNITKDDLLNKVLEKKPLLKSTVVGFTGPGGSGKSTLIDELVFRWLKDYPNEYIAIISIDPIKSKTGGSLLGDRIRMNAIYNPRVFMRSLTTNKNYSTLTDNLDMIINVLKVAGYNKIIIETAGAGQSDSQFVKYCDYMIYIMTPEYGSALQLEKIDMLDYANIVVINKSDKIGALDAVFEVRKQYQRNHQLFDKPMNTMPVINVILSQYNNESINRAYSIIDKSIKLEKVIITPSPSDDLVNVNKIIPSERDHYLSEISRLIRNYKLDVNEQSTIADNLYSLKQAILILENDNLSIEELNQKYNELSERLTKENWDIINNWSDKYRSYQNDSYKYPVKEIFHEIITSTKSLSGIKIPKITLPKYHSWGEILKWSLLQNVPGEFPFTNGVYPFRKESEEITRMFAGEGNPERTNHRFHYLSKNYKAKRLSTAFDSLTLYGEDPEIRPDVFGKIGNAGVSISCLDDTKKLYSGFDLCDPLTSVSMTINGAAPVIIAYYFQTAIDQQCEKYIIENNLQKKIQGKLDSMKQNYINSNQYNAQLPENHNQLGLMLIGTTGDQVIPKEIYDQIKINTLSNIRGTIQSDILKEDQAQNTCIFSTDFALKLMGDVEEYFIQNKIKNFYSVSISGYHIAEAGANPITQLAFTLANGFTYIEYYLSRGLNIDEFANNMSFFFSSGMDPEYSVIGRVARSIWAKAMKYYYKANSRSQKLKYHIQTSGRSLHSQDIEFNDIRTTLQALYAVLDNCNSLHTNAYDEAITTPTEESVRKALAIQLIIDKEFGFIKSQNTLQGSYFIDYLTEQLEEEVLKEFDRINQRGGVLPAMETMYQRNKIQTESNEYETQKENGVLSKIGVNTFISSEKKQENHTISISRSTEEERYQQVQNVNNLKKNNKKIAQILLNNIKKASQSGENLFPSILESAKYCSIGQITNVLYEIGGKYRRNI